MRVKCSNVHLLGPRQMYVSRLLRRYSPVALLAVAVLPLPAQAPSPVTAPIRIVNNHVHVGVTSAGRDLWFLLDTGAGQSLFDLPTATSLRIATTGRAGFAGGGAGVAQGATLSGASVRLAADSSLSVVVSLAMAMVGLNAVEPPVHGILGHDFIRQRVLQIDYAGGRLVLHDPKTFRYTGTGARVPIRIKDNYPHVDAQLFLEDGERVSADLIIDVGASGAFGLGKQLVERHRLLQRTGPTIHRTVGRGAGGSLKAHMGRLARVRLGGAELVAPIASLFGDSAGVFSNDRLFQGIVGGEVLRRFTVYLDYGRGQMILEPNSAFGEPFESDMSGAAFRLDPAGAGFRVADLMTNGPAERAGLAVNDLITAIDGRPATELGLEALRQRLRRPGGEVALTVQRAGIERVIRIPLRRLV